MECLYTPNKKGYPSGQYATLIAETTISDNGGKMEVNELYQFVLLIVLVGKPKIMPFE